MPSSSLNWCSIHLDFSHCTSLLVVGFYLCRAGVADQGKGLGKGSQIEPSVVNSPSDDSRNPVKVSSLPEDVKVTTSLL